MITVFSSAVRPYYLIKGDGTFNEDQLETIRASLEKSLREDGVPLWGLSIEKTLLSEHKKRYGGKVHLFPCWNMCSDEDKFINFIEEYQQKLGSHWDPYIVCFKADVDSSG